MSGGATSRKRRLFLSAGALALAAAGGLGVYGHWYLHRFDPLIAEAARECGVEGALLRAVIWKESRFNPRRVGLAGEIGLMQVTEPAAREWAEAATNTDFEAADLFNPDVNVRAGAWYLARALRTWAAKADPVPYALAEYNAGHAAAARWAADDRNQAGRFCARIAYPTTAAYVRDILRDYRRTPLLSGRDSVLHMGLSASNSASL